MPQCLVVVVIEIAIGIKIDFDTDTDSYFDPDTREAQPGRMA